MKIRKICVIFGGNVGVYQYFFKTINRIEKSLKCEIKRTGHFSFNTKIKDVKIDFLFCYGPIRDNNYLQRRKSFAFGEKELIPPPANIIIQKINSSSAILFLGLCGGLKGKKSDIYLPNEFNEILFKKKFINKKEINSIKNFKKIIRKNFLIGHLQGKTAKILTSNLTFQPKSIENENIGILLDIANSLSKKIDGVDKESYQIAKGVGKTPFGIMLMVSDLLNEKRFMLKGNFKPNINKFNKNCVDSIKIAIKKLK